MTKSDDQHRNLQHTRRHIAKAGAIAGAAFLATLVKPKPALAAPAPCFLKGTKIRTASGDRKVEDLVIGDLLPTVSGEMRPVQWIGRYGYKKSDPAETWVKDARPVCIAQSALGLDVPYADLYLTTGHALFLDGALVPVGSLINGTTITLDDASGFDELEYFHIKLESHDVIYAEGARCETLLTVNENARNFVDYFRMYGTPTTDERPFAPILSYDGGRSQLKSRLRSAVSPWVDRRQKLDVIRDRVEERGIALSRHKAPTP
jgi:hypothetical protein